MSQFARVACFWQAAERDEVIVADSFGTDEAFCQIGMNGSCASLEPAALFEGRDLGVTTDFRAVFSEVAGKLFDITDDQLIFPGWNGLRLPVLW